MSGKNLQKISVSNRHARERLLSLSGAASWGHRLSQSLWVIGSFKGFACLERREHVRDGVSELSEKPGRKGKGPPRIPRFLCG